MIFHIKNMVCQRCKMAVRSELEKLGLHPVKIDLGEAIIEEKQISKKAAEEFASNLKAIGFELIDDRRSKLIEQVKNLIIENIHYKEVQPGRKYSELLSRSLHHDYSYISNLFSEVEGITIEQYIINQRIEKVKELLMYDEKTISQIAFDLGYSSTAHLSAQFKKLIGISPSEFRQQRVKVRTALDEVGKTKIV